MRPIWGTLDPFYEAGDVLGRKVANSEFLRSLLQADAFQEYHFFLPDRTRADRLSALLRERHPDLVDGGRMRIFLRRELPRALSQREYACFHLSDCINHPGHLARLRNAVSKSLFPITSVTHSLSYSRYVVDFLTQLWPGTTDRDCIVATSQAGKQVVESYFSLLRNNLNLDGDSFSAPSVEQIPLGVDTGSWSPPDLSGKNRIRREFGLNEGDVAVLVFGRISPDSKMDLLPLLRALQRVKEGSHPPQVALILSGWLEKNEQYGRHLAGLAANLNLSFRLFPRPSDEFKKKVFQASDIFVSIADNPQETFGLTVLEAMAAGLPVVASDYDGYRAMVRHEENGFLIPTLGPAATESLDMLAPLCGDRQAHLLLGQQTVVSVRWP
ncbi:MAG: glycosyltransferase family 4 protein [Desulfovibrionales bacterium]